MYVLESERALPVHFSVSIGVHRSAVDETLRDVDIVARDRELERLRRAAHREQKSAALHELTDLLGDILLEPGHVRIAELLREGGVLLKHVDEPRCVAVAQIKLVELAREILVVEMKPVVLREISLLYFL